MPGGFCRIHLLPDGAMQPVYINEGLCKLTGMDHDMLMQVYADRTLAQVHPDDAQIVRDFMEQMRTNGKARGMRYRFLQKESEYIWLSVFGRVTNDISGDLFLNMYYTDSSEQVREEQRQKDLLDNLPCGAGMYEFQNGQMRLIYQNKSFWELVGLHEAAFPDTAPMSAIHPDDVPLVIQELLSAIKQGRDVSCDIRLRHQTSGYLHVHLASRVIPQRSGGFMIYATFTPISSDTLSYQEMLPIALGAVMRSQTEYAFVKNKSLQYICCSRPLLALMGYDSDTEVCGRTDYALFEKSIADVFSSNDANILETGEPLIDSVSHIPSADGADRYACISKFPLRDSQGNIVGVYGVGRDVTETRKMQSRFELLTNSIPGGIATYSYADGKIRLTYCNDGFCTLFGGTREGFQNRDDFDPMDWVFAEDRPELFKQVEALVHDGIPIDCVYRVHVIGGGYKWINKRAAQTELSEGKVLFNAVLFDITQRQEAAERIRISEEEYRLALQFGSTIVGRFTLATRTLCISTETAARNGHPIVMQDVPYGPVRLGFVAPKSQKTYIAFFEDILKGNPAGSAQFYVKLNNGWRWQQANYSTIYSTGGKAVSAVISFADVTERLAKEAVYKKWQQSLDDREQGSYTLLRCNLNNDAEYSIKGGALLEFDSGDGERSFNQHAQAYAQHIVYEDDRTRYAAVVNTDILLANYYRGKKSHVLDYRENLANGTVRWLRLAIDTVENPASGEVEAYLLYENIDAAKKAELQTKEQAETDPLTGVLNRTAFFLQVKKIIQTSGSEERHALLMLDIDGFKRVNDVFGHSTGDQALVEIANSLRLAVRPDDLIARFGGDEFLLFLRNIPNNQAAAAIAKRICMLIYRSFSLEVAITGSVGIAIAPSDGADFDTLYKHADAALYYEKGSGKNNFIFYRNDMADQHLEPESDVCNAPEEMTAIKKRRMLIVDDNAVDYTLLHSIFKDTFIIETARDGNSALVRLKHYGSAISVVLLDLMMPGMDGFAVLEKMQASIELRSIPVLIVSGDESRETCLAAIRKGATDFVTKPVDADILRIRVQSAISKAENERLRANSNLLEMQNEERARFTSAMESIGIAYIELNWLKGEFSYYPSIVRYLYGTYDARPFWQILLSDMVADTDTVKKMQQFVHTIAENRLRNNGAILVKLKTPQKTIHTFRMSVRKVWNEFQWTNRLTITLNDLDYEESDEARC